LVSKVKDGGMFASVIGVPESATSRRSVRTVAFVSKQNPETLLYMAKAVRDGKLKIPISQQLPLREARQGHIALERTSVWRCWHRQGKDDRSAIILR